MSVCSGSSGIGRRTAAALGEAKAESQACVSPFFPHVRDVPGKINTATGCTTSNALVNTWVSNTAPKGGQTVLLHNSQKLKEALDSYFLWSLNLQGHNWASGAWMELYGDPANLCNTIVDTSYEETFPREKGGKSEELKSYQMTVMVKRGVCGTAISQIVAAKSATTTDANGNVDTSACKTDHQDANCQAVCHGKVTPEMKTKFCAEFARKGGPKGVTCNACSAAGSSTTAMADYSKFNCDGVVFDNATSAIDMAAMFGTNVDVPKDKSPGCCAVYTVRLTKMPGAKPRCGKEKRGSSTQMCEPQFTSLIKLGPMDITGLKREEETVRRFNKATNAPYTWIRERSPGDCRKHDAALRKAVNIFRGCMIKGGQNEAECWQKVKNEGTKGFAKQDAADNNICTQVSNEMATATGVSDATKVQHQDGQSTEVQNGIRNKCKTDELKYKSQHHGKIAAHHSKSNKEKAKTSNELKQKIDAQLDAHVGNNRL